MNTPLIYIVEDNFFYANLLESRISKLISCRTKLFSKGTELITYLDDQPAFIFLDHHLPDCKGLDLIPIIKSKTIRTKIVVLSSQVKLSVAQSFYDAGVSNYLVKNHDDSNASLTRILQLNSFFKKDINKHPLLTNYRKSNTH